MSSFMAIGILVDSLNGALSRLAVLAVAPVLGCRAEQGSLQGGVDSMFVARAWGTTSQAMRALRKLLDRIGAGQRAATRVAYAGYSSNGPPIRGGRIYMTGTVSDSLSYVIHESRPAPSFACCLCVKLRDLQLGADIIRTFLRFVFV
eukprot:6212403-Pleurochrysis_carterae.AAC.3